MTILKSVGSKKKEKEVIIYSTSSCHYCNMAKDMFDLHGVTYAVYDVGVDRPKRQEMIKISDQMGVPVITIGGKVFVGFSDETKGLIKEELGLK